VFTAVNNVSGEMAEAEREFAAGVEQEAKQSEEAAEYEQTATEFAKRVHEKDFRGNEVKK